MDCIPPLQTGQDRCFDTAGLEIPCRGSGQDGEVRAGRQWPVPRFGVQGEVVVDGLTGLIWTANANLSEFPLTWQESLDFIRDMNRDKALGFSDWRLPNRRELHSLVSYQARKPALPQGHPFANVYLGWYWSSTTAAINPAYAWYLHFEGARMFYGRKNQYYLLWPVRGEGNGSLARTGQCDCFGPDGLGVDCPASGQDGEKRRGGAWPAERFAVKNGVVHDRLTNLCWLQDACFASDPVGWEEAFALIGKLNGQQYMGRSSWRLPNINELESLVDCSCHSPALPQGHPFVNVHDTYWSSTTSFFETDWAWALYLQKGALGVGYKPDTAFHLWPVCSL